VIHKRVNTHTLRHYPVSRNIPSNVGGARAAGEIRRNVADLRSAYSMTSELLEKGEQLVIGSKAADPARLRFDLIESGCQPKIEMSPFVQSRDVPFRVDESKLEYCSWTFISMAVGKRKRVRPKAKDRGAVGN